MNDDFEGSGSGIIEVLYCPLPGGAEENCKEPHSR
jgi:hypothetical protein